MAEWGWVVPSSAPDMVDGGWLGSWEGVRYVGNGYRPGPLVKWMGIWDSSFSPSSLLPWLTKSDRRLFVLTALGSTAHVFTLATKVLGNTSVGQ